MRHPVTTRITFTLRGWKPRQVDLDRPLLVTIAGKAFALRITEVRGTLNTRPVIIGGRVVAREFLEEVTTLEAVGEKR